MAIVRARITPEELTRLPSRAESLAEAALDDPEGVYTVARTYHGDKMVLFDAHLDRLEDSARGEGIPLELDRDHLRRSLMRLIGEAGFEETRLRLTIPEETPHVVLVTMEALPRLPVAYIRHGVAALTVKFSRSHPRVKSNRLEALRAEVRQTMPEGAYEGLITGPKGEILEGMSSNFYAVMDGALHTAEQDILHGISRQIVLAVAEGWIPITYSPVATDDLPTLSEAFMSSSSRGILPVVTINGIPIGDGEPGEVSIDLIQRYNAWVEAHLERLWSGN
jgi:branched-chain amino acid aminotransferase